MKKGTQVLILKYMVNRKEDNRLTGLAFLGQIAVVEKRLITAKKRVERYKADMDYVNRLSQIGKVSQTPDVTRNEGMMIKYMEAVDQVTALIQKKNAVIDRVEEKLMQMQTINGPEMLRGIVLAHPVCIQAGKCAGHH